MILCLYFLWSDDAFYNALFVDDESSAEGTHIFASTHALFAPHAKLLYKFFVGVGNESKG